MDGARGLGIPSSCIKFLKRQHEKKHERKKKRKKTEKERKIFKWNETIKKERNIKRKEKK